ncbi:MAG TPA: helical backbone metal receptor [Bdellovibrionota bacterium]|nr:helical backbone metal receptor [Bdellovibrionota bacterium]
MRAALWFLLLPALALSAEVVDETGTKVQLAAKPQRIVTLAPSLGELAADLDTEHIERIVGVSEYTDFPPALKKVGSIGPYHRFNLEKVLALKPDLVLATKDGNAEDQVRHLRELGLKVVVVDTSSLALIARSMRVAGQAMGMAEAGERMGKAFEERMSGYRRKVWKVRKTVLLQFGDEPLIVAGKESFLNEALELIGALNAYRDTPGRYIRPSLEDAVSRAPGEIVILALGDDPAPFRKMAEKWKRFPRLSAVKAGRVKVLKADALIRPTMRFFDGLKLLEEAVFGP